jgi:hypothetical protein
MDGEPRVIDARERLLLIAAKAFVLHQQCEHQYHDGQVPEQLQDQ